MLQKSIKELFSLAKAIIFALFFSIIISVFIIQPYTVVGSSMEPTLEGKDLYDEDKVGDKVMVLKSAFYFGNKPETGDLVIIDSEVNNKRNILDKLVESPLIAIFSNGEKKDDIWIKRVIGEEGDTIEYKDGKVYRNGKLLMEDYIKEQLFSPFQTVVVPDDHVFVLGDNRNNSNDSRKIGPVPIENVIGKVFIRFYPFNKFDFINK